MGGRSSKQKPSPPKPKVSRITEQDRAILQLKKQRDKLKIYQKQILNQQESLKQKAKILVQKGDEFSKKRALLLLRKKKAQDKLYDDADNQLNNIETLANDLEWAVVQADVVKKLDSGNKALKNLHALCSLDDVERIMDDTADAIAYQKEIDEALGNAAHDYDFGADLDDLENELEALMEKEESYDLPKVPDTKLPHIQKVESTAVEEHERVAELA